MKLIAIVIGVASAFTYADAQMPSPDDQKQSWDNSVNAGNNMNNTGTGQIDFKSFSDVNSGLSSLNNSIGSSTINYAKQAIDGSGNATGEIQGQYKSAKSDPNYLYNQGQAGIVKCKSQTDPACNAVTKYNDDDVRASMNQYNMGTASFAYNMYITPDPNNTTCSIIHSYQPINSQTIQCISGRNAQNTCTSTISPWQEIINDPPVPADGTIFSPIANSTQNWCPDKANSSGNWPTGQDGAWIRISSRAASFKGNQLPIVLHANSGNSGCIYRDSNVITTPTISNNILATIGIDWLGHKTGTITYTQLPGNNCGADKNTKICTINIRMQGPGADHTWSVTFTRPIPNPSHTITHYTYNDQCLAYK